MILIDDDHDYINYNLDSDAKHSPDADVYPEVKNDANQITEPPKKYTTTELAERETPNICIYIYIYICIQPDQ